MPLDFEKMRASAQTKKAEAEEHKKAEAAEKAKAEKTAELGRVEGERSALEKSVQEMAARSAELENELAETKKFTEEMKASGDWEHMGAEDKQSIEARTAELNQQKADLDKERDAAGAKMKDVEARLAELAGAEAVAEAPAAEAPTEAKPEAAEVAQPEAAQAEALAEAPAEVAEVPTEKGTEEGEGVVNKKFSNFLQQDVQEWIEVVQEEKGDDDAVIAIDRLIQRVGSADKYSNNKLIANLELTDGEKESISPEQYKSFREQLVAFLSEKKGGIEERRGRFEDAKKTLFDKKWEWTWDPSRQPPTPDEARELLKAYKEVIDQGKGSEIWQDRAGIVAMMRDEGVRQDALKMYTEKVVPSYEDQKGKSLAKKGAESAEGKKKAHEEAIRNVARQIFNISTELPVAATKGIDANFMAAHQKEFSEGSVEDRRRLQAESASEAAKELKPVYEKAVAQLTAAMKDLPPESAHLLDLSDKNSYLGLNLRFFARDAKKNGVDTSSLFEVARSILKNSRRPDQLRLLEQLESR